MDEQLVNAIIEARLRRAAARRLARQAPGGGGGPVVVVAARRVTGPLVRRVRERIGRPVDRPAGTRARPGRLDPACP